MGLASKAAFSWAPPKTSGLSTPTKYVAEAPVAQGILSNPSWGLHENGQEAQSQVDEALGEASPFLDYRRRVYELVGALPNKGLHGIPEDYYGLLRITRDYSEFLFITKSLLPLEFL